MTTMASVVTQSVAQAEAQTQNKPLLPQTGPVLPAEGKHAFREGCRLRMRSQEVTDTSATNKAPSQAMQKDFLLHFQPPKHLSNASRLHLELKALFSIDMLDVMQTQPQNKPKNHGPLSIAEKAQRLINAYPFVEDPAIVTARMRDLHIAQAHHIESKLTLAIKKITRFYEHVKPTQEHEKLLVEREKSLIKDEPTVTTTEPADVQLKTQPNELDDLKDPADEIRKLGSTHVLAVCKSLHMEFIWPWMLHRYCVLADSSVYRSALLHSSMIPTEICGAFHLLVQLRHLHFRLSWHAYRIYRDLVHGMLDPNRTRLMDIVVPCTNTEKNTSKTPSPFVIRERILVSAVRQHMHIIQSGKVPQHDTYLETQSTPKIQRVLFHTEPSRADQEAEDDEKREKNRSFTLDQFVQIAWHCRDKQRLMMHTYGLMHMMVHIISMWNEQYSFTVEQQNVVRHLLVRIIPPCDPWCFDVSDGIRTVVRIVNGIRYRHVHTNANTNTDVSV